MGFFSWVMGKKSEAPGIVSRPDRTAEPTHANSPTEKEMFQSPSLLASWVNRFILEAAPLENDYKLLPDEQTRKDLNITIEQRERCVREYSLLRIAGVSTFVKQHYPDSFWLAFSNSITPYVCRHMYGLNSDSHSLEVKQALEAYVDASALKDVDRCSKAYLSRVYDDSDHFYKLTLGGVGFIATNYIAGVYEIFRDTYCQVTLGMSYNSAKVVIDAIEKVNAGKA